MDILERIRHLNTDQKIIFYRFVYEDREYLSFLSIKELKGLEKFCNMCWDFITFIYRDDNTTHQSDQLYELYSKLPLEIFERYRRKLEAEELPGAPLSGCESCGWVHGYTNHDLRYAKEFEKNPEICPSCRQPTVVISKDSLL